VSQEDPLLILKAMKLEIPLLAPWDGVVQKFRAKEGDPIAKGDIAIILG